MKMAKKQKISLWTTKELAEKLRLLAQKNKTSQSEAVRSCLAFSMKEIYGDEKRRLK